MALANWMPPGPDGSIIVEGSVRVQGHSMYYFNSGSGSPLLLLHGLLGTASCWGPSVRRFSQKAAVYAVDFLGIGRSDRVPGLDAGLAAHAERLAAFLDAVGVSSTDIVATSHGGAVALQFAATYPGRVRSLILQAPANPFSDLADPRIQFFSGKFGQRLAYCIPFLPRPFLNLALGRMYADSSRIVPGALDLYMSSLAIPGTVDHVLNILSRWQEDMQTLEALLPLLRQVPTLLLWGSDDRAVSLDSAYRLMEILGNARLEILPHTGHLPYEEDPELFCTVVQRFLEEQRPIEAATPRQTGPRLVRGR
ncbi:alpha/beta fold hydrolase [Paracidobacterium acidisoli]|uniref:Alpha/beta hydrolase n=1 Tax=Paracidobacterium acidisoli TaxID=2303751 RepID=A0A372ISD5_9BACT|nr:alpha/beta hydrolase [Paracidobacterium acidisoli]MBT9330782.1 alpha/beta hydrolase [Paracidobacterium acidisoli]